MSYYRNQKSAGERYQKHIAKVFKPVIDIDYYTNKSDQYYKGESAQGIEIKYDKMFKHTSNLYIEEQEKQSVSSPRFRPSGIHRRDNTRIWVIGDRKIFYVFKKINLINYRRNNYVTEKAIPTSKGFLLHQSDISKIEHLKFVKRKGIKYNVDDPELLTRYIYYIKKICPSCRVTIHESWNFCLECGEKLK